MDKQEIEMLLKNNDAEENLAELREMFFLMNCRINTSNKVHYLRGIYVKENRRKVA